MSNHRMPGPRYATGADGAGGLDLSRLAAVPDAPIVRPDFIIFDGHEFPVQPLEILPILEMAARARRGDATAIDLLKAFGIQLFDRHKKNYWPVEAPFIVEG